MPERGGRDCCWYHRGDWHQVSEVAVGLLRRASARGVDQSDLGPHASNLAREIDLSCWELEALDSLFLDPIEPDREITGVGYVSGRHRAQAMLDAGVRRTIMAIWDFPPGM
ncbi:hypothetical protein AB0B66_21160 [Catellatospora sp. NPDC049111]|uniref:hypothetical protein n=1 Tax=Catellatospora sp. NPDC049111 TaxID=3155271 RepID=UPI0033DB8232